MKRYISSLLACFKQSPKPARSLRSQHRARPQLESLEERQLMSASPTHWVIEQQPASIVAGSPITLKVEALSAAGQVVDLTSYSISLAEASNPAGGVFSGSLTSTEASNGVITLTGVTINQAGNNYSLKVSGMGNGITLTPATTNYFSVSSGSPGTSPTHWVIEQQPASIVAGSPITLKVEALSAAGQVVDLTSYSISLAEASNPAGGVFSGSLTSTEASNGVITLTGVTINQAGNNYSLKVSGMGNGITLTPATTNYFSVSSGSPGTLTWTGAGGNSYWSTPKNWNLDRAPISGDTLVFPSGPTNRTAVNNISGLSIPAIDITGSYYNFNPYPYQSNPPAMTVGSITFTGANDTLALANNSTLTGSVADSGANNYLDVSNTTITGTQYIVVSAGNKLTINPSWVSRVLFSGAGDLVIDGAGTVLFGGGGQSPDYDTCTTILVAGTLHFGQPVNNIGGGDFYNPAPWGPVILAGGTFGDANGLSLPSLVLYGLGGYGKVTFDSGVNVTGDVVVDGSISLTLANSVSDFCTTGGSALEAINGGHITLSAAYNPASNGVGGILTVPYQQVGLVTAGYETAVYKDVSNPG